MHRTYLFTATALAEVSAGLALLACPALPMALLLGVEPAAPEDSVIARIAGAGLLAFGIACWAGRNDPDRAGRKGLLLAAFTYDVAAAAVLGYAGWFLSLAGVALWPAILLHGALALWCAVALLARPENETRQ
jgi:hypothetical protein